MEYVLKTMLCFCCLNNFNYFWEVEPLLVSVFILDRINVFRVQTPCQAFSCKLFSQRSSIMDI